jgi:anti-sigma factor RsiW
MTICRDVEPQLSQLVDGLLPDAAVQAMVREHLESCAHCRGVLQDLERLRRASRALGPIAPPDHVWLEVAGQMRLEERAPAPLPRRVTPAARSAIVQWVGLAAAIVLITTAAYFVVRPAPPAGAPGSGGNAQPSGTVEAVADELNMATTHYDKAIQELEALAKSDTGAMDPAVAKTLQQNIQTIDRAIGESRTALAQDPGSEPARESLFEALRRKVVVLQTTVTLMNEMRKGNPAGAAEAAAALNKKS